MITLLLSSILNVYWQRFTWISMIHSRMFQALRILAVAFMLLVFCGVCILKSLYHRQACLQPRNLQHFNKRLIRDLWASCLCVSSLLFSEFCVIKASWSPWGLNWMRVFVIFLHWFKISIAFNRTLLREMPFLWDSPLSHVPLNYCVFPKVNIPNSHEHQKF